MYANLRVKPDGHEAIYARSVTIHPDGRIIVIEDGAPEGAGAAEEVEHPVHETRVEDLPEGGLTVTADF